MGLPKRIRDGMAQDGQTTETIAAEVLNGDGDFGLNDLINGQAPVEQPPQEPAPQPATPPVAQPATPPVAQPAPVPVEPAPASSEAPQPAPSATVVNPFDVGFEEDEPAPVAQPAAPVTQPAAPVAQPAAPVAQPAAPVAPATIELKPVELTPEEIAMFGGEQQARTFMAILDRVRRADAENVQALDKRTREESRAAAVRAFRSDIAASVPEYDQIVSSKSWQKFVHSKNPLASGTIGNSLLEADARMDRESVLAIFGEFRKMYGGRSASEKAQALAVPGRMAAAPLTSQPAPRYKFPESYGETLVEQRRTRQITSAEFHSQMQQYEDAKKQGLVELGK